MWVEYDLSTGAWIADHEAEPDVPETSGKVQALAGYPALYAWDAELRGFVFIGQPKGSRILAVREYLRLLTDAELGAVLNDTDVQMKIIVANTLGAQNIDLDDPEVADGLAYCVFRGHLTADRPERVLANLPPE